MLEAFNLVNVSLAALVVVIVASIVRAVRLVNTTLGTAARHVDLTNPDIAKSLVDQIRRRDLPCPRCGGDAFALLGTQNCYQCDACHVEFEGPEHLPGLSSGVTKAPGLS